MVSNREKENDYFLHSFTYPLHTPTHIYAYINNTRMRMRACVWCVGAGEGMKE